MRDLDPRHLLSPAYAVLMRDGLQATFTYKVWYRQLC